ncbi:MAG: DUF2341 domain-containing protein, partial [Gammaproteobacteria bacterium]
RMLYIGTDGRLYFGSFDDTGAGSEDVANSTATYTDGAWHYAVGVRNDATNMLSLYVDGTLVDTSANAKSETSNGYWRMGGYKTDFWTAGADGYFNGSIDEARVSTQVRSADWIGAQYLSMSDGFVSFGAAQGIGVLGNDSDPTEDALTAVLVSGPSNAAAFALNANGSFTYTPTANWSGVDTFTYQANDGSGNSNVGTVTITVSSVNDAPALADTLLALNPVNESAGAPSGAVGTLVSSLVGGASDVDSGAVQGIAITAADATNGTWWYSTDDGTNWNLLGAPSAASSRLLAADADTRIYFQPNAGFSGTIASAITLHAWDQTSGSNGGTANTSVSGGTTAFSSATDTASITVNPVNAAPTATDDSYSVDEGGSLTTGGAWWNSSWGYRQQIVLDNPTASTLTDFALRVKLDATFDYAAAKADGSDLRFVDADGVTVLSHEIESWNPGGDSYVWVKVPQLNSGADSIWMYYGNGAAAAPGGGAAVWSNGYRAVYHFGSDPGAFGVVPDSAGNGLDGVNNSAAFTATGVSGGALDFDSSGTQYVNLGPGAYLSNVSQATLSAWINPDALTGGLGQHVVGVSGTATVNSRAAIELLGPDIRVIARAAGGSTGVVTTAPSGLTTGSWHHVAAVIDYVGSAITVYVDGNLLQTFTSLPNLGTNTPATDSDAASIAVNESLSGISFGGLMDEVSISAGARSADEIAAHYANVTGNG